MFYAHSGSGTDKSDWQTLSDHLNATALIAGRMGEGLGIGPAARLAGLLHDLGKYTPGFQKRLSGGPSVDHSTAGAKIAIDHTGGGDRPMAELIAYAILGHHAGLPDRQNDTAGCFDRRLVEFANWPDLAWKAEIKPEFAGLMPTGFRWKGGRGGAFQFSVLGRMLFSCLVDADFKETERFYAQLSGEQPDRDWPELATILPDLVHRFDAHMSGFMTDSEVNRLRRQILGHVRSKAGETPGLFTLTVPTGGGKTLASLGFALDHAKLRGHRRIIYAIPFTSIIDQTAAVFRRVLGEEVVLEHHSAIEEEKDARFGAKERRDKLRLAMEDWAAPVIVTTNVQLFESLFAARPGRARKLHNIAGSVIILDEAQTLPRQYLLPVMRMLEELAENHACSIVLCTATQPALGRRANFDGLELSGRELAPDPVALSAQLRRAQIRHVGAMDNVALIDSLNCERQALVVVNSRKHALDLFRAAQAEGVAGLTHLTTRQCAAHRQQILADVRSRLQAGSPCRVIATSLVEAGVDIDFPKVWRAEAGLDQIVQAAGRCNREGRRAPDESVVTVFAAPDYTPPREIALLTEDMRKVLAIGGDALDLDSISAYFREVYWRMGPRLDGKSILKDFTVDLRHGTQFAYRAAAEKFRMIESDMAPVIVEFDEVAKEAVHNLAVEGISSGKLARQLQRYIVQVPPKARALLLAYGHVTFANPELRGDQFAVLRHAEIYQSDIGLLWENAAYLAEDIAII